MKNDNFNDVKLKIKNWLMLRHHNIKEISESGWAWSLVVTYENESFAFVVRMDLGAPDCINLNLNLDLSIWQSSLNNLPARERKEFLYDLRFKMLAFDLGVSIPLDNFSVAPLTAVIYLEELSQAKFWKQVNEIHKAMRAIVWSFERKFTLSPAMPVVGYGSQSGN